MRCEKGNVTLAAALMLVSISSWGLIFIQNEAKLFERLKSRLGTFSCAKNLNGEARSHIRSMEMLNRVILTAHGVSILTITSPPVAAAARAAKKAAQAFQNTRHFLYFKKLFTLSRRKCLFNPDVYKTPYQNKGILKRDATGRAKLWRRKWNQTTFGDQAVLKTKVTVEGTTAKQETKLWEIQEGLSLLR